MTPALVAAAITAILAPAALRLMTAAGHTRPNWRGAELPFPAGAIAVAIALLTAVALDPPASGGALVIGLATAAAGLIDDLVDAPPRGLRAHAAATLEGRPTTGLVKVAAPAAAAAIVLDDLLAAAVVTLAAHVFNLLDLRPGRATKAFVLVAAVLIVAGPAPPAGIGLFAGPLLVLGAYDLRERAMLGDTGSTLLGAMAGLYLVTALGTTGRLAALAVLAAIAVYGEHRSLTRAIEQVPPLRALDWLGRKHRHA